MLAVDRMLRRMGGSGFETQMFVVLSARLDTAKLRDALARLGEHYPVAAARLVETGGPGEPCWRFRPGAPCPLREADLASADPGCRFDYAGRLLSAPVDLAESDPIRFHVLHLPDGRDVFLLQYNHALMDNNATALLLAKIDRLAGATPDRAADGSAVPRDLVWDYLRSVPRGRRRQALLRIGRLWGRWWRGGVATLARSRAGRAGLAPVRIASRRLEPDQTGALRSYALNTLGFPSLSVPLVGSVFRAIGRLAPRHGVGGDNVLAGIGVDLGLRGRRGPIFQNLVSLIPLHARPDDLRDRDGLVRMLGRQMREQLAGAADLGVVQQAALMGRQPWHGSHWLVDMVLRRGFSLWYAYFGSLDAAGDRFCGVPVEDVFYAGPCWPPVGLTLLVNQFRGRLLLQATYVPESVPDAVANEFLDEVVGDLARP
jgi:hypothetical protein